MFSDDDRRDVAARLRAVPVLALAGFNDDGIRREWEMVPLKKLSEAVGMDYDGIDDTEGHLNVLSRLADLIEPPTQCPYYHSNQNEFYCSVHEDLPVGSRDALLALADKIECKSNDGTTNPDPMRPLATSLDLFGYARCIRKALGAEK